MLKIIVSETYEIISPDSPEIVESDYNFENEVYTFRDLCEYMKREGYIYASASHYEKNICFSTKFKINYYSGNETKKNIYISGLPERGFKYLYKYCNIKLIFD